jgi:hypothetical protein
VKCVKFDNRSNGTKPPPTSFQDPCQVLRATLVFPTIHTVQRRLRVVTELPLRPQDETECRRCDVHCDKVVYPAACVEGACPFLYAFEEHGRTYVGCMQKIYDVEIDLELLEEAQGARIGFGAVKAVRQPLPMCRAEVSSCYENRTDELGCVNPEFFELPQGQPSFRVVARADGDDRG